MTPSIVKLSYIVPTVHELGLSVEYWWDDLEEKKLKYSEENLSQLYSVHHTSTGLGSNQGRCRKRTAVTFVVTIMTIIHE